MVQQRAPIVLIFDSGVGGLSVLDRIRAHLPGVAIVYAADNAAFPYGTKTEDEVIARVTSIVPAIARGVGPDLVVLACNTASTVALEPLRALLSVPVVGVVPAIKPAAGMSRSRVIGLLGTPGTVRRVYTQDLIDRHGGDCTVIRHGSAELVEMAERRLQGLPVAGAEFQAVVDAMRTQPRGGEMDVVVLACTHFPLVAGELAACGPASISWIDSGDAIARRVEFLLREQGMLSPAGNIAPARAIFTADDAVVERLRPALLDRNITGVEIVTLGCEKSPRKKIVQERPY